MSKQNWWKSDGWQTYGKAELSLVLVSITSNGITYIASSSEVKVAGKIRTKKSGAVIGGVTASGDYRRLGRGGKGAAIGALSGAGAGWPIRD